MSSIAFLGLGAMGLPIAQNLLKAGHTLSVYNRTKEKVRALEAAGADIVLLECIPAALGKHITEQLHVPVIGIGAGPDTDGQVLVWQDMAGLRTGRAPRFVKRYADLAGALTDATRRFADEVRGGEFPAAEHTF